MNSSKQVEAVYPLSSMQHGMLFHALQEPASGLYLVQLAYNLEGSLDTEAFAAAWQQAIQRHGVFRTAFSWKGDRPLQIVFPRAQAPFHMDDWTGLTSVEQRSRLRDFLAGDRERGFDLSRAPLMRFALFRIGERQHHFVWSNHHTILDGWSAMLVMKEVLARYEAIRSGRRLNLPPTRPYRDYISWLTTRDKEGAERYWREMLAGFREATPIPLANRSSAEDAGQEFRIKRFSKEQTARISQACAAHRVTLNALLQGLWGLLLCRYTGSGEAVFGATVSCRPADVPGFETTAGLFINTIPVRVPYRPDERLWERIASLQSEQIEARRWDFASLAEVQRCSEIPPGIPLFQSLFVFENYAGDAFEQNYAGAVDLEAPASLRGSATGQDYTGQTYRTNYPLLATVRPGDELLLRLTYEKGMLSTGAAETLLTVWSEVLEAAAVSPLYRTADLPFLPRALAMGKENGGSDIDLSANTVVSLFEQSAAATPEQPAIAFENVTLTYRALNERANQTAAYLRRLGVGPEARVAILFEPGIEAIVAILAILKCGGAYVPLDVRAPVDRVGYQIEISNVVAILTTSALRRRLPASWVQVVELDGDWREIAQEATGNLEGVLLNPEHAAYVIFTSGSTGQPKGVVVSHRSLSNYIQAAIERIGFAPLRYALVSSLAADLGHTMLFPALCSGGLLDVISQELARDGAGLAKYFENARPAYLKITPSHLRGLMEAAADTARDLLPTTKLVLGGEASDSAWVASLQNLDPHLEIWNHYGPTECTVGVLTYRVPSSSLHSPTLPLGYVLANTAAFVLDSFGDPSPDGVPGELYIAGAGVARGYEMRPDLTAERFVPNPFATTEGQRLYRTGDLVRRLPSGELEFLGRTDTQVKIRGHRIELSEIEAVLRLHGAVSDAVAVVSTDLRGESRIVAYVASGQNLASSELREHSAQKLPDYMIPSTFVVLPSLPLLPNGKLDRKALPEPESAEPFIDDAFRSPIEEIVAAIWAFTLELKTVRRDDDFFALGGHSLNGTQVVSRIRQALGVDLPLRTLFDVPKLCDLASQIESLRSGAKAEALPLVRCERERTVVCSFAQQRLWFVEQLEPGNFAYNIPRALKLTGVLDVSALAESLTEIVRRHEVLRTVIVNLGGQPAQLIRDQYQFPLPLVDLTSLSASQQQAASWQIGFAEARLPFDLAEGPLFRGLLLALGATEHVLFLSLHHIISDAWSAGVFVEELSALYNAFRLGQPSPLPELPVQYADFAIWQRKLLDGEYLSDQLSYWMGQLDGLSALQLPTDRPRPLIPSRKGADFRATISASLTAKLEQLAQQEGVTLYIVVLAAFQFLLGTYAGQEDVATASPIANRNRIETERLIGFFVNTLVMRNRIDPALTFRELLARVRETVLDAYAHQDLPFERLVEELQPERDLARSPLFQVVLTFQNAPLSDLNLPGVRLQPFGKTDRSAKHDLTLFVEKQNGALECLAEYAVDLFDESTIAHWLTSLERLFQDVVSDPTVRLRDLSLLTPADRDLLQRDWGHGKSMDPAAHTIVEWFERVVAETPDAVALGCGTGSVSYGELNRRANQLAQILRSYGVGPEVRVALCVERGLDMVVGLLGIVKSGGAYVPLDASYPLERLSYMVEDAGAPVVVTQEHLRDRLPWGWAQVLTLDSAWDEIAQQPDANPERLLFPGNLAYVIYTSGSTGKAKAADLTHRGAVNLAQVLHRWFQVSPGSVVMQFASLSFDSATWDWMMALLAGGKLILASREEILPGLGLERVLFQQQVEVVLLTPSVIERMDVRQALPALRAIAVAGEACPARLFALWGAGRRMINAYGPTETTVCASLSQAQTGESGVSIGGPLPNLQTYVLDAEQKLSPVGAPGELYVGGIQVARGYANRRSLTAERFVPDPFSGVPGARLYRTGDIVRWRNDGELEFVGRADGQVKLRGHRIELGEIETMLREHSHVAQAAVAIRETSAGEKQLAAYITPKRIRLQAETLMESEKVAEWQMTFEETYSEATQEDQGSFHIGGWTSSYTNEPIPADEMREWVRHTVDRIRRVDARRILEIGCGTGLLLFPLASECEHYLGTDFAADALRYVHLQVNRMGLTNVELRQASAHQFDEVAGRSYDTVVLNSVVQYFPDAAYLVRVLKGAVNLVRAGGTVFVGDVRSLPLLEAFHTSVEAYKSEPGEHCDKVWNRVRERIRRERELTIDPELFFTLGAELGARRVDVLLKQGAASNELVDYRFDVQIQIGESRHEDLYDPEWQHWDRDGWTVERLRSHLQSLQPEGLGLRGVPNRRVAHAVKLRETLERAKRRTLIQASEDSRQDTRDAVDPMTLWSLAQELSYEIDISLARGDSQGRFDVVFRREGTRYSGVRWPEISNTRSGEWEEYVNDLQWERRAAQLKAELPSYASQRLPDYMIPSAWVMLDHLPLSPSGKLDRKALPEIEESGPGGKIYEAPRGPAEEQVSAIWSHVLKVEQIGREDNFFELGGHSLLATQVISRLRDGLGIELPLRSLFEAQTVRELAAHIERLRKASQPRTAISAPVPADRSGDLPLSFAQKRLWFLNQLDPQSAAYHIAMAFRLTGEVDVAAIGAAINQLVERHEVLRTLILNRQGEPVQRVAPYTPFDMQVTDLSSHSEDDREQLALAIRRSEAHDPFDLETEPPLRTSLIRMKNREHLLLFTMHHIASDGWSTGILAHEFRSLYETHRQGLATTLPTLPIQYGDFAFWQQSWLSDDLIEKQIDYWRSELAGLNPLNLPKDHPDRSAGARRGEKIEFQAPANTTGALHRLSQSSNTTLFAVVLATWQILLSRYSGQDDIAVGCPIANRTHTATENLIGFFANTLVLRSNLKNETSFETFLAQVARTVLDAQANQDVPFEKLVEALAPDRASNGTPFFQVMLAFQNAPDEDLRLRGLSIEPIRADQREAKFDLTLNVREIEDGRLSCQLEYAADLFEPAAAERMCRHWVAILESITANPAIRLADIPLLSDSETLELTQVWNATSQGYPDQACLHDLISAQAVRVPHAIAVSLGSEQITYGELERRSNQLKNYLCQAGFGGEQCVGILMDRSCEMVIALVGVLKAGAAYLPLEPSLPPDRLQYMIDDAGAHAVIASDELACRIPSFTGSIVRMQADWPSISQHSGATQSNALPPDGLAYIIYTSGSTGKPKAVMAPHRGLVSRVSWMLREFGMRGGENLLQRTPLSFDASSWEFYVPLASGSRLVLAEPQRHGDSGYLTQVIREQQITTLQVVPSLLGVLLDEPLFPQCRSLKWLFCGAEALPRDITRRFFELFPTSQAPRMFNLYGPTEASPDVTFWQCSVDEPSEIVPIGKPIANTQLYILDQALRLVPPGVHGELMIGGVALARGYWGRPSLTAERFIPNPHGSAGSRLYRTGDLARYRHDGCIEFLGRIDHQVKIRGFRIETGEVESVLAAHPAVRKCAVVALESAPGLKHLAAYVVPEPGQQIYIDEVRLYLQSQLPDYMVPAAFIELSALPLNASGKLDRNALPAPIWNAEASSRPASPLEAMVADLWSSLLQTGEVGREANFFALGGHSLLATRMISRVRALFNVDLPLRVIFETPVLREFVSKIQTARQGASAIQSPPIRTVDRSQPLPVSTAQRRLWFLQTLDPGSAAYNVIDGMLLGGPIDLPALQETVSEIVKRHEILRTRFVAQNGEPIQVVDPPFTVPIAIADLSGVAPAQRRPLAKQLANDQARTRFDLSVLPLLRLVLIKLSGTEHLLVALMHHIVNDGWSIGILGREFRSLYALIAEGKPSALPPLELQYADYAAWERGMVERPEVEASLAYWRNQLSDIAEIELPKDRPRPNRPTHRSGLVSIQVRADLLEGLKRLGRSEGATLFMTLTAAFQMALSQFSERDLFPLGTTFANRSRPEWEGLLGFFANQVVLRSQVSRASSIRELLGQVRNTVLDAHLHQQPPFERVVEAVSPHRDVRRPPLFEAKIVLNASESQPACGIGTAGLTIEPWPVEGATAKFDLLLLLTEKREELSGALEFDADIYDRSTAERITHLFEAILRQMIASPESLSCTVGEVLELAEKEHWNQLHERAVRASSEVRRGAVRRAVAVPQV